MPRSGRSVEAEEEEEEKEAEEEEDGGVGGVVVDEEKREEAAQTEARPREPRNSVPRARESITEKKYGLF